MSSSIITSWTNGNGNIVSLLEDEKFIYLESAYWRPLPIKLTKPNSYNQEMFDKEEVQ